MEKEITIYDIAKQLSISATTVSRALPAHPTIDSNTKMMITTMAKELGYRTLVRRWVKWQLTT